MTTTPSTSASASPSAATTPIPTFADLLAALERNPELRAAMRQHILDQEFQQLPAEVQELRQIVAELQQTLREFITAANARFDRIEANQAHLQSDVAELKAGQAEHNARLERLEAGQEELKAGQAEHTARLERLEAGQEELRAGQDELRAGQAELKAGQDVLRANQISMQGDIARLNGRDYERNVIRSSLFLAENDLGCPNPQIIWSETGQNNSELSSLLAVAVAAGRISRNEAAVVSRADIVLRDGAGGYCLAEVSITLDDSDITRARRRADLLAQAAGAPAQAFVIGTQILDTSRAVAAAHNVTVCILPY